jgi:hypothetical protein
MPLQIRRGTEFQRLAMTVPLASGELLFTTDDGYLYVGNGSTLGGVKITGYNDEDAVDAVGAALVNGVHSGITFTYGTTQDVAGRIDAAIDLSNYPGTLKADAIRGTIVADDSTILVDAVSGRIVGPVFANVVGNVTGDLTGNVTGNINGVVTGTPGSTLIGTVNGDLVGNTNGYHTGDVKGSVFGFDSSLIVDADSGTVVGNILSEEAEIDIYEGRTIKLEGTNLDGIKAGIVINTDGDLFDPYDLITINQAKNNATGPGTLVTRSRGTLSSPAPLQTNDVVFTTVCIGRDSNNAFANLASTEVVVNGSPTPGYIPTKMNFNLWNGSVFETILAIDESKVIILNSTAAIAAGGGSGEVNVGGGVVSYLKVKVGSTFYGIPMYGLNP